MTINNQLPSPTEIQSSTDSLQRLISEYDHPLLPTLDGYVVTDGAGTIQVVNSAAATLLRTSPDSLRGKPMLRYLVRDSRKYFLSVLRRLRPSMRTEDWEISLKPQQGPPVNATLIVIASRDLTGKFFTLHCHLTNTSSRAHSVSPPEDVNPSANEIQNSDTTLLCTHDLNGTILFASRSFAHTLGCHSQQMIGCNLSQFLSLAAPQEFSTYLRRTQLELSHDCLLRFSSKRGKVFTLSYRSSCYEIAGHTLYINVYAGNNINTLRPPISPAAPPAENRQYIAQDRAANLSRINEALQQEIATRKRVEHELQQAQEELERRVAARTVELSQANALLEREILERRQAQEALRNSEARYRLLSASAPIGIAQADTNGNLVYTNARWQQLAHLTAEETLGDKWLQAVHQEDRLAVATAWTAAIRDGHEFSHEWRFLSPSGETCWVHARATPIRSSDGELVGHVSTLEDITTQKNTQALLQEEVQVSRDQTIALARTLKALTAVPALDSFLSQVLTAIAQQLKAPRAYLWLSVESHDAFSLYMFCENGKTELSAKDLRPSLSLDEAQFWPELVQTHRPLLVTDLENEPRLTKRELLRAHGIRSILLVPLVLEEEATGWLSLYSNAINSYRPEEIELAQALAQQVALAMQLANFAEQRRQAAILDERNRLAREIHDTLAQGLTGIVIQLEAAKEILSTAPDRAHSHVVRAAALARESLTEARRSVRALRPQVLEHQDLPSALERLASQFAATAQLPITFTLHGSPSPLPTEVAANLLRISQEAIINAWKHGKPQTISLDLEFFAHELHLRVQDDGRGFDILSSPPGSGFGLTSMRERAERLGGVLTITSTPGHGTTIAVTVPNSQLS